jgi:hypothetical protein
MSKPISLKPQNISKDEWYYEETKGLCMVVKYPGIAHDETRTFYISWKKLEATMARYRKHKRVQAARKKKRAKV